MGRFAVHKLGDRIDVITRAKGQPECVVSIDWAALIKQPFLADARVTVRTRPPEYFKGRKTGTRLTISGLREINWSRGEVRRLSRQITSISSPFADRSDKFEAVLEVPEHPEWVAGMPDIEALLARAPWHFQFSFEDGRLNWSCEFRGVPGIKVAKRRIEKEDEPLLIVPERDFDHTGMDQGKKTLQPRRVVADATLAEGIGPVTGEFYVFDRDRTVLKMLGDTQLIRNYLDENGGVRVYRGWHSRIQLR